MAYAAQTVTLLVEYDPERYDAPVDWRWSDLADQPITVVKATEIVYLETEDEHDCLEAD